MEEKGAEALEPLLGELRQQFLSALKNLEVAGQLFDMAGLHFCSTTLSLGSVLAERQPWVRRKVLPLDAPIMVVTLFGIVRRALVQHCPDVTNRDDA